MKRFALLALVAACAAPAAPAAPPPCPVSRPTATVAESHEDAMGLTSIGQDLRIDPASSPEQREAIRRWYGEALSEIAAFFGSAPKEPALVIVCTTDPCAVRFSGPTRRSRALMKPRPTVVINGIGPLTKGTLVHEWVHVEILRCMGERRAALPTWFDEGVASFIGDNAPCPQGYKPVIDDLRRLRTGFAWESLTNTPRKMEPAYCQAREEIAAWVKGHGRPALLEVIDAVTAGKSFDDAYGPLVIPPATTERLLDARFALDENSDTNGVDSTGRPHLASLLEGATWTTGYHHSGVKVLGGGVVRLDDLFEYALPDKPFSISLWAKPLVNAHTLIHTSQNPSGGEGWCIPLLGYDESGHLVAQVPFDENPNAFLATATGPVLPLNKWVHLAVTWEASDGLRLYVDGKLAASAAPKSAAERHRDAPAAPMHLFFGGDHGAQCWTKSIEPGPWSGSLDEIHIYNYALPAEAVVSDMR